MAKNPTAQRARKLRKRTEAETRNAAYQQTPVAERIKKAGAKERAKLLTRAGDYK